MRRAALVLIAILIPCGSAGAAEPGWTQRALALQYELAGDLDLRNAPWVGTHNSFNSVAEMGQTLSTFDSNQQIPIVDQLEQGIRSIELDLHWFPSASGGGFAPVVCHARGEEEGHLGCTAEKEFGVVLGDVAGWLRAHPGEVLLLYIEDDLGSQGHDTAAARLSEKLGDLIYLPAAGAQGCAPLPMTLTRNAVRAAGKQVIAVSGCGKGTAWPGLIFDWSYREEERPRGYRDFPDCDPTIPRATYDAKLIRYYEDSTQLTATVGSPDEGISLETAGRLARCGVDLTGFDQLLHDDPRLQGMVWSWSPDQPAEGRCAIQSADGRWRVLPCRRRRRVACRAADGSWAVSKRKVRAGRARRLCSRRSKVHAVPRTGYEGQLLRAAMTLRGARAVWLGYRRGPSGWAPLDHR